MEERKSIGKYWKVLEERKSKKATEILAHSFVSGVINDTLLRGVSYELNESKSFDLMNE